MPDLICPTCGSDDIEYDDAGNCQCQMCWCNGTLDDFAVTDEYDDGP